MLTIHALTTQLQSQTLTESKTAAAGNPTSPSHHEDSIAKIRHHSEPHRPILTDVNKKVKIITFKDGISPSNVCVSSLLLTAAPDTSSSWDAACSNPPNKRQCRSMSIPNDGELHARWLQTQSQRRLHRPVAVRPNSGGSRSKTHHLTHQRSSQGRPHSLLSSVALYDGYTPPESPRSRPSSASSGYFDSPLASFSNLTRNKCESLQMLPISSTSSSRYSGESSSDGTTSTLATLSAKSMPSVAGDSLQYSPSKHVLLRCQSQPCVARERRCGIKRRRDDERNRPSIDFSKMTETAISGCGSDENPYVFHGEISLPVAMRPSARFSLLLRDSNLQTIASSPQDAPGLLPTASTSPPQPSDMSVDLRNSSVSPSSQLDAADSDSGCSTTDEEFCTITKNISKSSTSNSNNNKCCCGPDRLLKNASGSVCFCDGSGADGLDHIFDMEPATADGDIDLDMIENN